MKTKAIIFLILLILPVFLFVRSNAQTSAKDCYIKLRIKEIKTETGIEFRLEEAAVVYGDYQGLVKDYDAELVPDYTLNVYVYSNTEIFIEKYSLYSSRFIHYDTNDPANPGGVIELGQSIIEAIIPANPLIGMISVENQGQRAHFEISGSQLKCQDFCISENGIGNYEINSCCSGLSSFSREDDSFICLKCGDGVCSQYETANSCRQDCVTPEISIHDWQKDIIGLEEAMKEIKSFYKI